MHRALRGGDSPRLGHHSGTSVDAAHPYLNIHSASYTGNFGLVSYALSSGVSPSAALDGITPLHAACAGQGSNEAVVNYLIEHGADVNAPRGSSRRASVENNRTPRVGGALGYTPLHFAVSSGHTSLLPILLAAGADPSVSDKHGMLPHQLAQQTGRTEAEALLMDALTRRASTSTSSPPPQPIEKEPTIPTMKRLKSLENALRHHHSSDAPLNASGTGSSSSGHNSPYSGSRRPSFPDTSRREYQRDRDLPPSPPPVRTSHSPARVPLAMVNSVAGSSTGDKSGKRPRSAGAGAGGGDNQNPSSERSLAKKLGTKYSLLNVLRRNTEDANPGMSNPEYYDRYEQGSGGGRQTPNSGKTLGGIGVGYPYGYRERKGSLTPSSPSDSTVHTPALSTSPTYQHPPRPGILRTHRRSSSNSLSGAAANQALPGNASPTINPSAEISRRPSTRTLRFEDPNPSPLPSSGPSAGANGAPWNAMGSRKMSDASDRASSDYMMARRPSDHLTSVIADEEPVDSSAGGGGSTNLKRLALANSNRARAGTSSTVGTTVSGELVPSSSGASSPGSMPVDIPLPPKDRMKGHLGSPSGSPAGSHSPGTGIGIGIEGDPDVPEYSSDLSEEDEEEPVEEEDHHHHGEARGPPEVPSKDGEGVRLQLPPLRKGSSKAIGGGPDSEMVSTPSTATGYPGYHPPTIGDEEEHAQYARYEIDAQFEDYDDGEAGAEDEAGGRLKGLWSSPDYTHTPFSAPVTGPRASYARYRARGGAPASASAAVVPGSVARSDSMPVPFTASGILSTSPGSNSTASTTPSISGPASAQSQTFSIRSHREARHLIQQVQREILVSAQSGSRNLSEQLAAYGETLAIERRFAIGEKQRWRNTAKEEDEEDTTGQDGDSRDGKSECEDGVGEDGEEENVLEERAALRMRERERGERERKLSNSIGRVSSIGSLRRTKGGVRPKPKPLVNRRPHTSSGVSGAKDGAPSSSSVARHRSTRSATAPIIPPRENGSGIEIVRTVPTPPGSHSPTSSLSNNEPSPSSYIQSYSFAPSSPLRMSLGENADLDEKAEPSPIHNWNQSRDRNPHPHHHHTMSNGSTKSKTSNSLGFGGVETVHIHNPVSLGTSTFPQLSPIMSESSSSNNHTLPHHINKNKSLPFSASLAPSLNAPSTFTSSTFTSSPSTLPRPPQPRIALDRIHATANAPDFGSLSSKVGLPRTSTSEGSLEEGLKFSPKGEKKSRFGGLKNFVQTIKGGRA